MDHRYYNQHLLNDFDTTGDTVRRKNRMKQADIMSLSVSFIDPETLTRIKEVFTSLPPEEMLKLKEYLYNKEFLKRGNKNESGKIVEKITQIALASTPKDETLKKIKKKFNDNLEKIDRLKQAISQSDEPEEMNQLYFILETLNEQNAELFGQINEYRAEVFAD